MTATPSLPKEYVKFKKPQSVRVWTATENGKMLEWFGGVMSRKDGWVRLEEGGLGLNDYESRTTRQRRDLLRRRGYRLVRATLTLEGHLTSIDITTQRGYREVK